VEDVDSSLSDKKQVGDVNTLGNFNGRSGSSITVTSDDGLDMEFSPVRTLPLALLHLILIVGVEIQACLELYSDDYRFILIPGIFLAVLSATYAIARLEHRRLRSLGYLRFYIQANKFLRIIFFVVTLSNSVGCIIYVFYNEDTPSKTNILIVLVTLELLCSLVCVLYYTKLCINFNRDNALPDAHAWQQSQALPEHELAGGSRVQASSRDIIQKQALMIRHLDKQLRSVSDELQKAKQQNKFNHMSSRRSDFDYLLNAKDNEIRALRVECDRLKQDQKQLSTDLEELRKTHGLVQNEQKGYQSELENVKNTLRKTEKEKAQLALVVQVHEETNSEMRREIDNLRTQSAPT